MPRTYSTILTLHEIYLAAMIGVARRIVSIKNGDRNHNTNKVQNQDFGWHTDIEAACAELAVAKFLGVYWDGSINTFKAPDVGVLQIRHTQHDNGSLILREKDNPAEYYVLVTGKHPLYRIRGYILGSDGLQDAYKRDPNGQYPAWFVPQNVLLDASALVKSKVGY